MSSNPSLPLPLARSPIVGPTSPAGVEPKARGANRSTKVAGKLKVLPEQDDLPTQSKVFLGDRSAPPRGKDAGPTDEAEPKPPRRTLSVQGDSDEGDEEDEGEEEEEPDVEVYNQIAQIPAGTARRDALRLTKKKAKTLPRVTAYATATSYKFPDLMKFLEARRNSHKTQPRRIEEVIYTTYYADTSNSGAASATNSLSRSKVHFAPTTGDLLGVPELQQPYPSTSDTDDGAVQKKKRSRSKFDMHLDHGEMFLFEYGVVVFWGMTEAQEKRFLSALKRFEIEKLPSDEVEVEDLNYYYASYSRIYNDVITLRDGSSYMTKLSLSHALAQSVKISLFEQLISTTIDETKDIPEIISETGKIGMPHQEIMRQIGELFILRTNINLVGSVLDSPEVFWSYPDLQPLYDAARSYLEIPQRINLLNARVEVLQDMLQLLKDSVSSRHSERLEQIVIALICVEIVLGVVTILVDLFL